MEEVREILGCRVRGEDETVTKHAFLVGFPVGTAGEDGDTADHVKQRRFDGLLDAGAVVVGDEVANPFEAGFLVGGDLTNDVEIAVAGGVRDDAGLVGLLERSLGVCTRGNECEMVVVGVGSDLLEVGLRFGSVHLVGRNQHWLGPFSDLAGECGPILVVPRFGVEFEPQQENNLFDFVLVGFERAHLLGEVDLDLRLGVVVLRFVFGDPGFENSEIPHIKFGFEKVDIVARIVVLGWFAFHIGCSRKVDDMDQHIGLVEVGQKLVAESISLVCARNQPGHVDEFGRYKTGTVATDANVRRTGFVELGGRTLDANVRLADTGVDRGKRIGTLWHVVHRRRIEKTGFTDRRLAHQADFVAH